MTSGNRFARLPSPIFFTNAFHWTRWRSAKFIVSTSKSSVGISVSQRLKRPKNYSCRPVLIHINGVTQEVADSDYFAAIIDMGQQRIAS